MCCTELTEEGKRELDALTLAQRHVVLGALQRKLTVGIISGKLPYRFDLCAVCNDVGSTEENPRCGECYIQETCQRPFVAGFKDSYIKGTEYFTSMRKYLTSNECKSLPSQLVVGGTFDNKNSKPSKIAASMAQAMGADLYNGGWAIELSTIITTPYNLIVWMANVPDRDQLKEYPRKKQGCVLVVSKVMREGYTSVDAAKRLFSMHANAVIEIYDTGEAPRFRFRLADALSNAWADTTDVPELIEGIYELMEWTNESMRLPSVQSESTMHPEVHRVLSSLLDIVRKVSDDVQGVVKGRYFGNVSTRCMSLFPSVRSTGFTAYVSARNISKEYITPEDMILVYNDFALRGSKDMVIYHGERKPSVDTPIQLALYQLFPEVNFMIHGHAYIMDAAVTENYYPCGDLREFMEVVPIISASREQAGSVNLKKHGFLVWAHDLSALRNYMRKVTFVNRL